VVTPVDWTLGFSILAFSIASNLDNFGVGLAYGLGGTRVTWPANLAIAIISAVATGSAMLAGQALAQVNLRLASEAGAGVIGVIGLWIALKSFVDGIAVPGQRGLQEVLQFRIRSLGLIISFLKEPVEADADRSGTIDLREAPLLGAALSVNCIAGGVAVGLMGYPYLATSLTVAAASFLAILGGWRLGRHAGARWLSRHAGVLAGLLLILLSVLELMNG